MSKHSKRPNREEIKIQRKEKKRAEKELRQNQKAQGLDVSSGFSAPNRKSIYTNLGSGIWGQWNLGSNLDL
ncbi:MAG: hypothetical protein ACKVE4_07000 [Dissulfuribacterales bacterium]